MAKTLSVLFILFEIYFLTQLMFLKKNNNKLNFVKWLIINIMLIMSYHAIVAGILSVFNIRVGIFKIGLFVLVADVILTIYNSKHERQKYCIEIYDIVAPIVIIIVVMICAINQFGTGLDNLNFETSDPANHLKCAMDVAIYGKLNAMYFNPLNNGLFIELCIPFLGKLISVYRLYIFWEMFMLFFSGISVYLISRDWMKNISSKAISLIFIFFYMCSYPLNSMVFGFGYLSMGISIVAMIILLTNEYINKTINEKINIIFLSMIMFSILVTYTLFAPFIYLASAISILIFEIRQKNNIKLLLKKIIFLFVLPGLFGSFLMVKEMFSASSVADLIKGEGYIYTDLFINSIIFLPFAIATVGRIIKRKENNILLSVVIVDVVAIIAMLFLGLNGKVSAYYYSKMYYMLSLVLILGTIYYLTSLTQQHCELSWGLIITGILFTFIYYGDVENEIMEQSVYFNNKKVSYVFYSLYDFNYEKAKTDGYSKYKLQLYDWINENVSNDKKVPCVSSVENCFWYAALTKQRMEKYTYYYAKMNNIDYLSNLKDADYVIVDITSEPYCLYKEYFDSLEKVFQNYHGFVAVIK